MAEKRMIDSLGPKAKSKLKEDTKKNSGYDSDDDMENHYRNMSPSDKNSYMKMDMDSTVSKASQNAKPKLLTLKKKK